MLEELKTLTSFMAKGNFYDDDQTREMVVDSLKNVNDKWSSCHWADLINGADAEQSD